MPSRCLLLLLLSLSLPMAAQVSFTATSPEGHPLPCRVLPDGCSVELTHPAAEWPYHAAGTRPVGTLTLPPSVVHQGCTYRLEAIGECALYGCDSLLTLHAPAVRRIGPQALNGCKALETVTLGDSLEAIGEGAFAYCRSLRSLALPDAVQSIGISAFAICEGLAELSMSAAVHALCDALTFHGCPLVADPKNRKIGTDGRLFWSLE